MRNRFLYIKNNKRKIHPISYLFFSAFFLLIFITWIVFIQPSTALDDKIADWMTTLVTDQRTSIMRVITFMGNFEFLLPAYFILIGLLLYFKQNRSAWRVAAIAISGLGLKLLLKELFHRVRPDHPMIQGITNFSFPSGHALMSVTFYGLLIWLAIRKIEKKSSRVLVILFLSIIIFTIGLSRIYLRVHYTTDVIAGFCIGACWVCFCLWVTQKIDKHSIVTADTGNVAEEVDPKASINQE
ncbi:MAG TPA: phosphatase PAP2 family protein [Chitinophagaceae bacterium]|nr:phosphatase PAP2 family protein [Chitinophagaceae bacterium]